MSRVANSFAAGLRSTPPLIPILALSPALALLCNDASLRQSGAEWIVDGDPMEGALIAFAMKAGVDPEAAKRESPRLKEIPFDSRYRFMATLNPVGADRLITVKGAPERVLELCATQALRQATKRSTRRGGAPQSTSSRLAASASSPSPRSRRAAPRASNSPMSKRAASRCSALSA